MCSVTDSILIEGRTHEIACLLIKRKVTDYCFITLLLPYISLICSLENF